MNSNRNMLVLLPVILAAFESWAASTAHPQTEVTPERALEHGSQFKPTERRPDASLREALVELQRKHAERIAVSQIATTDRGRPIVAITVSGNLNDAGRKPAVLLVAGFDGHRWAATEASLAAIDSLATENPPWLREVTVYAVPRANPDAAETFVQGPRRACCGNGVPYDNDRDARDDEDPPTDLDGDGVIVQLRARNLTYPWPAPTHVADTGEPRLLRLPDPAAGTTAEFAIFSEGYDRDGDGRIGEDWSGGIDPERNFPHDWPEFEDEAGPYPLFATESKAIANFVFRHRNIFAVLVLGRHDTMVNLPDPKAKTSTGLPAVIGERDMPGYSSVAKEWRDTMGQKRSSSCETAGSLVGWLNVHRGIPAFASTLWGRPDIPAPEEPAQPAVPPAPKPVDGEAAEWLRYSDTVRGGTGFVPWKRIQHPQLADAEVGGWVPGFRENPPLEEVGVLGERLSRFLGQLAARRPVVELSRPEATELAPGIWRITTNVANRGSLPTLMQPARAGNGVPAHSVRISVPVNRVTSGQRVTLLRGLDPGQQTRVEWIVASEKSEAIRVELAVGGLSLSGWTVRDGQVFGPEAAPIGGVQ